MQTQASHTGTICLCILLSLLILLLHAGVVASGPAEDQKGSDQRAATDAADTKTFSTSFVSLSAGHAIATSLLVFGGGNAFSIKIPDVHFLEPAGSYARNGLMFTADFSATILKQKKHYRYSFSAKGISLFDSYIAGTMVLDELINETGQEQKVTFIFWGTPEAAGSEEDKTPFPF